MGLRIDARVHARMVVRMLIPVLGSGVRGAATSAEHQREELAAADVTLSPDAIAQADDLINEKRCMATATNTSAAARWIPRNSEAAARMPVHQAQARLTWLSLRQRLHVISGRCLLRRW